jgi:hypothetical protein
MSISCDIILTPTATPEELHAVGIALWHWCTHASEASGLYQFLDNQALADLIQGSLPLSSEPQLREDHRGIRFRIRDEASRDRLTTVNRLRRVLPTLGIADILVEGVSWQTVHPVALAKS